MPPRNSPIPVYFQTMSAAFPPPEPQPSARPGVLASRGTQADAGGASRAPPQSSITGQRLEPQAIHDAEADAVHKHTYPEPLLRLQIDDLSHPAAKHFLHAVDPVRVMRQAVETTVEILYGEPPPRDANGARQSHCEDEGEGEDGAAVQRRCHSGPWPEVRSITLILDEHGGVAETSALAIDHTHKEIRLNMGYIETVAAKPAENGTASTPCSAPVSTQAAPTPSPLPIVPAAAVPVPGARLTAELTGVLLHETVHTLQHARMRSIPSGLIEGVADWVRLRAGLAPPHWKREAKDKDWDDGYATTAWFLDWLEEVRLGKGTVSRVNMLLSKKEKYDSDKFWRDVAKGMGAGGVDGVEGLWKEYAEWLERP